MVSQEQLRKIVKKWKFNQEEISNYINIYEKLLTKKYLGQTIKEIINEELLILKCFQNKNYDIENFNEETFHQLKLNTLTEMKEIYYLLQENFIDWLIELDKTKIFNQNFDFCEVFVSIENQFEYTLKNYELHSKKLLPYAKELLYDKVSQIQLINDPDFYSYSQYLQMIKKNFLVINPKECGYLLNHEVQHYIEQKLNLSKNIIYSELGSIYFELLFTDEYYEQENKFLKSRVEEANYDLEEIVEYLNIIKAFKNYNFEISDEHFKEVIIEYKKLIPEEIEDFLLFENKNMVEYFIYFISFLKAVELREKSSINIDSLDVLNPYLKSKKFIFEPSSSLFKLYENYVDDVKQKTLKK